jgi:putative nucleotidyltransferase with HDIG domain
VNNLLSRALSDPELRPLPRQAEEILLALDVSPRLAAHLRAVHDVAVDLCDWAEQAYPGMSFDREAVLFGAATHDIGKVVHTAELSEPGSRHEAAGYEILRNRGVEERLARFARTHATWDAEGVDVEDLLVSLADKVWKAKRVHDLEQLVVDRLAAASGQESWEVFMALDDILDQTAKDADRKLGFQSAFPV